MYKRQEFDWALPGNGILIWHIDNNIIENRITENKINADMNNRGVDVEEADGIQDIGVEFQTIFGDVVIGEGEQRDMWFSSNDADLYKNRFAKDTRPDTRTNSGANSLITISGFSDISNKMNFRITFGDSVIKPILSQKLLMPSGSSTITHFGNGMYGFTAGNDLYLYDQEGTFPVLNFSKYKPSSFLSGDTLIVAGASDDLRIFVYNYSINPSPGVTANIVSGVTSNPVIIPGERKILVGAPGGKVYIVKLYGIPGSYSLDSMQFQNSGDIIFLAAEGNYLSSVAAKDNKYTLIDNNTQIDLDIAPTGLLLTKNSENEYVSVVLSDSKIVIANNGKIAAEIKKEFSSPTGAALTDLKQDGNNYIAFNDGNSIKVYNLNGFPADNFPYTDPNKNNFEPYLLAADFEGDNASEIIAATSDGRLFAFDGRTGKPVNGFPISTGKKLKAHLVMHNNQQNTFLSAIDSLNNFYVWNISSVPGKLYWYEEYGNPGNTAFSGAPLKDNFINTFFPSDRVYNYPNPAYDNKTFIRYYVSENSKVNIKIFDLAGALVDELNADAAGGSDNETEWNISSVQSGVYLARIEASGTGGKKEVNIIKIAVVK